MDFTGIGDQLTHLTWQEFAVLAIAVAFVDWVVGVLSAISPPNVFSWAAVSLVLETHVLKRIVPIAGLAFIAQGVPVGPAHDAVWLTAVGALGLYVGETVKSLAGSIGIARLMANEAASPAVIVQPATVTSGGAVIPTAPAEVVRTGPPEAFSAPAPEELLGDQAVPDDEPED